MKSVTGRDGYITARALYAYVRLLQSKAKAGVVSLADVRHERAARVVLQGYGTLGHIFAVADHEPEQPVDLAVHLGDTSVDADVNAVTAAALYEFIRYQQTLPDHQREWSNEQDAEALLNALFLLETKRLLAQDKARGVRPPDVVDENRKPFRRAG